MEAIGQLTGGVAHDFNNLLGAIVGNLAILGRRLGDERLRRYVDGAMAGARRGAQLTGQLLAFARRQRLVPQPVDVNALLDGAVTNLLSRTLGGLITVELLGAEDLWAAAVDISQLEAAVLNLAVNARDAMPEGGTLVIKTSNVRVGAGTHADLEPGDYVLVAVTDTGAGMPPDVAARATEPFFTTKGVGKGTGLGLSTVSGFLRQSGGTLRITSHPGAGTTIQMYLPRSPVAPAPPAGERATTRTVSKGELVLVVDDDDGMRTTTGELLGELGYPVVLAQSGARALDILAANPAVRLMVADYAMPGMTGAELLARARDLRPDLKVIIVTGYAQGVEISRILPASPVLRKPFSLVELAEGLHAAQ
ncbi:MAG: response regulator [Acetobacteraceae bacterium]|nr:response regulator [Acetobacteraceae bacterium]